ncbi:hypothetical protein Henu3_gp10 [Mycobacterium phage Henu3 PeY-2017]|nr:hypothetical protein Henu3_gp10 [Mycobacterium phage Henu3 PeY-2017]
MTAVTNLELPFRVENPRVKHREVHTYRYGCPLRHSRCGESPSATVEYTAIRPTDNSIEDLCERVDVGSIVQSEPNQEGDH